MKKLYNIFNYIFLAIMFLLAFSTIIYLYTILDNPHGYNLYETNFKSDLTIGLVTLLIYLFLIFLTFMKILGKLKKKIWNLIYYILFISALLLLIYFFFIKESGH
jgi:hypothetical protein